jgi:protocatechuate 3,4-dioxygenase beta subunit
MRGQQIFSVLELFDLEMEKAYGHPIGVITGYVIDSQTGDKIAGVPVVGTCPKGWLYQTSITKADGSFILSPLYDGINTLSVDGYLIQQNEQVYVPLDEDVLGLQILVTEAAHVSGVVTADIDGSPLADASVTISSETISETFTTFTGEDGSYSFPTLVADTYTVTASYEDFVPEAISSISVELGETRSDINFSLIAGATVTGTVNRANDSQPVENALVVMNDLDGNTYGATTNGSGEYAITGLRTGQLTIYATHDLFLPSQIDIIQVIAPEYLRVDIELELGASISGTVVDNFGVPIQAAVVFVEGPNGSWGSAVTDDNGEYEITGLGSGFHTCEATADGYVTGKKEIENLTAGSHVDGIDFQIKASLVITGTVSEADGVTPIAGAILLFRGSDETIENATTGDNGVFTVDSLGPGVYYLRAWADDFGTAQQMVEVPQNGSPSDLYISLHRGTTLSGVVVDSDGLTRVPDAWVHLCTIDGVEISAIFTDEIGEYAFRSVPPGTYSVEVTHPELCFAADIAVIAGTDEITCNFQAASGGIAGTVTSADTGVSLSGAKVNAILKDEDKNLVLNTETNASGLYSLPSLIPGDYVIICYMNGFGRQVQEVTITGLGEEQLSFALPMSLTFSGTVSDIATGEPIEGAIVWIVDSTYELYDTGLFGITDEGGNYVISGLSPGVYMLWIWAEGYAVDKATHTVSDSTNKDVSLTTAGYTVSGNVVDLATGLPLANASIIIYADRSLVAYAESDSEGSFSFAPLSSGEYEVAALFVGGYASRWVSIVEDTNIILECSLDPGPNSTYIPSPFQALTLSQLTTLSDPLLSESIGGYVYASTSSSCPWWLSWLPSRWCKFWQNAERLPNDPWEYDLPPVPADCPECIPLRNEAYWSIQHTNSLFDVWDLALRNIRGVVLRDGAIVWVRGIQTACSLMSGLFGGIAAKGGRAKDTLEGLLHVKEVSELRDKIGLIIDLSLKSGSMLWSLLTYSKNASWGNYKDAAKDVSGLINKILGEIKSAKELLPVVEKFTGYLGAVGDFIDVAIHGYQTVQEFRYRADKLKTVWDDEERAHKAYEQQVWLTLTRIHKYLNCLGRCEEEPPPPLPDDEPQPPPPLPDPPSEDQDSDTTNPKTSVSPEDKWGPAGYDAPDAPVESLMHFVQADQEMSYRIEMWNKPDAPVPTQDATIQDLLDPNVFDLSTFEFTRVGFLKWDKPLPGGQTIDTRIDCRPDMNIAVEITGTFDPTTGRIDWWFHTVDPLTGEYPEDPFAGFLPPFNPETGYEIGWMEFTVQLKPGLPTGTQITNQAFVQFDFMGPWGPAPKTGPWINTIDAGNPSSQVDPLPEQVTEYFMVTWSGQDDENGSGIGSYDICVSTDGGLWQIWLDDTTETSAEFAGEVGHTYAFRSVATDNVGHIENDPGVTEAQTTTTTPLFRITRLETQPCGFVAHLNRAVDTSVLNLYDTETAGYGPPDVTVVGETVGAVSGSLVVSADGKTVSFIKTGGPLEPDTYTVTVRSEANAFKDIGGYLLDGDADYVDGGDYVAIVNIESTTARLLSIPDFTRGPGQEVNVPAADSGICGFCF